MNTKINAECLVLNAEFLSTHHSAKSTHRWRYGREAQGDSAMKAWAHGRVKGLSMSQYGNFCD